MGWIEIVASTEATGWTCRSDRNQGRLHHEDPQQRNHGGRDVSARHMHEELHFDWHELRHVPWPAKLRHVEGRIGLILQDG